MRISKQQSARTAPRLANKIKIVLYPERRSQVVELVHKKLGRPELLWRIGAVRGRAVADLVIEYDWDATD